MKRVFPLLLAACFFQVVSSFAVAPAEEARVVAVVKKAFATKDAASLVALYYWDGVPDDFRKATIKNIVSTVLGSSEVTEVRIVPPPANQPSEIKRGDTVYRMNLPITRRLKIKFADQGSSKNVTLTFPLGEKKETLLIPNLAPVK